MLATHDRSQVTLDALGPLFSMRTAYAPVAVFCVVRDAPDAGVRGRPNTAVEALGNGAGGVSGEAVRHFDVLPGISCLFS